MTNKQAIPYIIIAVLLVIILGGGFSGYNLLKKNEQLQKQSVKRQDSLRNLIANYKLDAEFYEDQANKLDIKNKKLHEELKRKEKDLSVRDTSFRNNASNIAESVNRYYKKDGNARQ